MTKKTKWMSGARTLLLIAVAIHVPDVLRGQSMPRPLPPGTAPAAIAAQVEQAPRIDGVLDEAFWETIPPIADFRQRVPVDGGGEP